MPGAKGSGALLQRLVEFQLGMIFHQFSGGGTPHPSTRVLKTLLYIEPAHTDQDSQGD